MGIIRRLIIKVNDQEEYLVRGIYSVKLFACCCFLAYFYKQLYALAMFVMLFYTQEAYVYLSTMKLWKYDYTQVVVRFTSDAVLLVVSSATYGNCKLRLGFVSGYVLTVWLMVCRLFIGS